MMLKVKIKTAKTTGSEILSDDAFIVALSGVLVVASLSGETHTRPVYHLGRTICVRFCYHRLFPLRQSPPSYDSGIAEAAAVLLQ